MRRSMLISLSVSVALALLAVLGTNSYLSDQRRMLQEAAGITELKAAGTTLVVAAQPMRRGASVEASKLKVIDWPTGAVPQGAFPTIDDIIVAGAEPRHVISSIEVGEPILAIKITGPGQRAIMSASLTPGLKAVSIRVNDVLGVGGFVLPGDRVDIMLTQGGRRGNDSSTDVLLQGVKVLAIDQLADDRSDKPSVVRTVTLEVSTQEGQKLTLAQSIGILSLALRNFASSAVEKVERINVSDLGGGPVAETMVEDKVEKPVSSRPNFAIIGVSRGVQRQEYKVSGDRDSSGN